MAAVRRAWELGSILDGFVQCRQEWVSWPHLDQLDGLQYLYVSNIIIASASPL
jgi:hypothetical protein